MHFLLVFFTISWPFVVTYLLPVIMHDKQTNEKVENGPWPARLMGFVITAGFWGLNEVAVQLETPFHVAQNDINVEEVQ
jgi:predicted membrane chloride channel (bestrophin family)